MSHRHMYMDKRNITDVAAAAAAAAAAEGNEVQLQSARETTNKE